VGLTSGKLISNLVVLRVGSTSDVHNMALTLTLLTLQIADH
jgi:hypothetical protein